MNTTNITWFFPLALISCAGAGEGDGALNVLIEPESVIQDGLMPGDSGEGVRDGWVVTFDEYTVAVGDVDLELAVDRSVTAEAPRVFVVDLLAIPDAGLPLWSFPVLRAGRWEFHYATPGAAEGASRHESVTEDAFDDMVGNDFTYRIVGALSKSDGRSCPPLTLAAPAPEAAEVGTNDGGDTCYDNTEIRFSFSVTAPTHFGPCEVDGVPGVSVPEGGTQTAAITIHGDHLFFNGFPTGNEGETLRLAQWLADCDLDLDGNVTRSELEQIKPSDLHEMDAERFQLGSAPIENLSGQSLWIYVTAQLKTQGHLQGEGECPIDGEAHED